MDINERTRENRTWAVPPKYRMMYGLIFVVALVLVTGASFKLVNRPAVVAGSPLEDIKAFKEQKIQFGLVSVHKVAWAGGGAFATVGEGTDQRSYPYATIINRKDINGVASLFLGHSCALDFEIETRKDLPWVSIDQVRVKVISYSPLPKYHPIFPAPFEEKVVYYVELDDPKVAKTDVFTSDFVIKQGKRKELGSVRLIQGKPEEFFVRINAKTPGIYTLQCALLVRNEKDTDTVKLTKVTDWLFDGQYY